MERSRQHKEGRQRDDQFKGVVMVIGGTDTGKTYLIRQLLAQALTKKGLVALVDADMGQSSFGPPSCMSLTLWKSSFKGRESPRPIRSVIPLQDPSLRVLHFIGSLSPMGYLPQVMVGIKRLVDLALERGADPVLIDTTGMIKGRAGFLLKQMKIELLRPRHLLVLEKNSEFGSLLDYLCHIPNMEITSIPLSSKVRQRSWDERREYRCQQFRRYLQKSRAQWVYLTRKKYLYPFPPLLQGSVVGLRSGKGETLGIGVIRRMGVKKIEVITPVKPLKDARVFEPSRVLLEKECWGTGLNPSSF